MNLFCTFQKYRHQWKSVKREYILIVLLHAIENFLLVLPAIYTYSNVKRRNSFLQDTVGLLPLESIATQRWGWIIVLIPSMIIMSVPLQLVLIWAFNKYGHPWKRFFAEFSVSPKRSSTISAIATTYING